jgi:hypothetical protein
MENNCSTCIRLRDNRRGITNPKRMNEKFCRKCKEEEKLELLKQKRNALKELVTTNPLELFNAPLELWTEAAMKSVVDAQPSMGLKIANTYEQTSCHMAHDAGRRASNKQYFTDAYNNYIKGVKEAEAARKAALIPLRKEQMKAELLRKAHRIPEWNGGMAYLMLSVTCPPPKVTILGYDEYIELVKIHPGVMEFVPWEFRTYELCMAAIKTHPPEVVELYQMCGECFPMVHVPVQYRTEEMCIEAASWSYHSLWCIPPKLRTLEMYKKIAMVNPGSICMTMPTPFCDHPEILAIRNNGAVFI